MVTQLSLEGNLPARELGVFLLFPCGKLSPPSYAIYNHIYIALATWLLSNRYTHPKVSSTLLGTVTELLTAVAVAVAVGVKKSNEKNSCKKVLFFSKNSYFRTEI